MSLLPAAMANSCTPYYAAISVVERQEKTIEELREKIALMQTTISALTMAAQTNNAVGQLAAQNAEILNCLQAVRGSFGPLNSWLHRNKWV